MNEAAPMVPISMPVAPSAPPVEAAIGVQAEAMAGAQIDTPSSQTSSVDVPTAESVVEVKNSTATETARINELREQLGISESLQNAGIIDAPKKTNSTEELRNMDFYKRLNIERDASQDSISKSKKIMFDYHPDHGGDEESMKEINLAYETLSDPEKREKYDAGLGSVTESTVGNKGEGVNSFGATEGSFWEGVSRAPNISESLYAGSTMQTELGPKDREELIRIGEERIQELQSRNPKEYIAIPPSTEVTVADYLERVQGALRIIADNTREAYDNRISIKEMFSRKIEYLGISRFKKILRGVFSI